jgi:lipoprotein NlpI
LRLAPFLAVLTAGSLLTAADAIAQLLPEWMICAGDAGADWDVQIKNCTAIIESRGETTRNLSVAYNHRGNAYEHKGDHDRAIADYDQAIALDPKYAWAFNGRGIAYDEEGDLDRAIADYDSAITLVPKYGYAYNNRGIVYEHKGDHDRAIADYDQAIALDPKFADAYNNRGIVYEHKGDHDRAIADYDKAIALDPKHVHAYFCRGLADLYVGALPNSLADLNQSSALNPKDAYGALWLDIVGKRSNLPSRLAEAATQIDMTKWPAPVIRLYLGQMTPESVLAAANDPDANTKAGQVCEANFYTGLLRLQQGAKDEAARLLKLAASDCPRISRNGGPPMPSSRR